MVLFAIRNLADRDLLLKLTSSLEGFIGFFVKISKLHFSEGNSGKYFEEILF